MTLAAPTRAAPTDHAPVPQPSASFVAVNAAHDDAEPARAQQLERRSISERLQLAAFAAVSDARRYVAALIAIGAVVLCASEWAFDGRGASASPGHASIDAVTSFAPREAMAGLAAVGAFLAAALCVLPTTRTARQAWQTPQAQRRLAIRVASALTLVALVPWFAGPAAWGDQPALCAIIAGLVAAVALPCSAVLAPLELPARCAAALPLSPAAAAGAAAFGAWRHAGMATSDAALAATAIACILASLVALGLSAFEHRRWLRAASLAIEQDERVGQLERARDAAIRADQEKSRFLAIASHDLRQPVHAIGLFAATLEKRLAGSVEEPLVRNLNRAIDGLDRSFNVMLDISRLDAGAIEPRVQQFPLRDLFRRLHMHFAGQAEQKGLGLRFSPGGKSISSDPQLLERVLGNLVQNAIKYTEHGGIVVIARSTKTHTNVEIWDTGVGIRAGDLRKVFDEFYQVGRGERVRAQGLGMGLAIVKRLVRLMGHDLTVSSRPGRGTMFRLSIAVGGLPDIQDVTAAADTLPMPLLQPRTVLVLDDEEPIREGLCLLLQEWGYDAIAAGSIAEAESAVDQLETPPDLILSDLHLGEGPDGIAGIEAIRRRCGSDVAAMLITGDTTHAEIRRATESGHPVLFKPVQPRKLYDALRGLGS